MPESRNPFRAGSRPTSPPPGYTATAGPPGQAWRIGAHPLSREERVELVRYAYDRGVRYFDTSPVYMESEAILGEALKDRRGQVCLVTKVESTKPGEVRKSVEQSLKALQTDYLGKSERTRMKTTETTEEVSSHLDGKSCWEPGTAPAHPNFRIKRGLG